MHTSPIDISIGSSKTDVDGHIFRSLMAQGKIHSALSYLSRDQTGGILGLDDIIPQSQGLSTRDILRDKHPPGKPACPESLLPDCAENVNPIIYSDLDAECILQAALHTQGAAGLSGLDAYAWRRLCSSFKTTSHDLCHALAAVGRRICSSNIHPDDLSAFVSCGLIPLNKNPGVRPIGVGEVPRRIIAKAILSLFRLDIQDAAGPLQVCAGQDGGCEAAVHAMRQLFAEPEVQGALLVDASNAFNTINRQSALHNIKSICPPPPLPDTHEHIQSSSKMHYLWRRGDHLFRRYYTGGPASHGYVCACCETTDWGTEVGCPRCETSMVRGRCHRCRHL